MEVINGNLLLNFAKKNNINSLIVSSSFEDRCFVLSQYLDKHNFDSTVIYGNFDFEPIVEQNAKKLNSIINSSEKSIVSLSINKPILTYLNLHKSIVKIFKNSSKQLIVDVTTFTHEGLLILFKLLFSFKRKTDSVFLVYNGAKEYSYNEVNSENKWLTKGVKQIRSVVGYPGYSNPSKKNHLVVLFGFEQERTLRLIEQFDCDIVSLAFASESASIDKDHQILNFQRHAEVFSCFPQAGKFSISLTDPMLAKTEILDYLSNFKETNTIIAPMNNKISTIGAAMAAIEDPNIQLCYLQAARYNLSSYSKAGDNFFIWRME